jgi:hypothetical protein
MKTKYRKYNFPVITILEIKRGAGLNLFGYLNYIGINLFDKEIIISYNGLDLKLRPAKFNDYKAAKISKNLISFGKIEDRHNWIGTFELVQDGDWYVLERIEE